jgi:hypothetical protein
VFTEGVSQEKQVPPQLLEIDNIECNGKFFEKNIFLKNFY